MTEPKFFICKHCGNVITKLVDKGVPVICCGEPMEEMTANTSDGAQEKHVPAYTFENGSYKVQVGSVPHPMLEEHHIGWIWLFTEKGGQLKNLKPGDEPTAEFTLAPGDKAIAIYEWCNLHGLWKAEVK